MTRFLTTLILTLAMSSSAFAWFGDADYEVTITNVTKAQIFAPIVVATHRKNFRAFTPGEPASPELATLAESGNPGPLTELLENNDEVWDVNGNDGLLMPGESVTITITGSARFPRLSLASMLVTTNDAFAGLDAVLLPYSLEYFMAPAYDAGSELNDESCENIPGPPCGDMDDSGEEGEGYIYIGNGIQGNGDVNPENYDWNNAVATVKVRRVR